MNTKTVGVIGATVSLVCLLSIVDIFVSVYLEPRRTYRAFPGTTQPISDMLKYPIGSLDRLTFETDTSALRIEFVEATGTFWRGNLVVGETVEEGDYRFLVFSKDHVPREDTLAYTVKVFEDKGRYQASFKSVIRKWFGVAPWWISVVSLPLALLSFWAGYVLSTREANRLAQNGIAEIYWGARRGDHWEITFGLGHDHGIRPGDEVTVFNDETEPIGKAKVASVSAGESRAHIDPALLPLKPNAFVSKAMAGGSGSNRRDV